MTDNGNLERAIAAAEARKVAALGDQVEGFARADNPIQARAIFSGFDIDHDELAEIANRVGIYFFSTMQTGLEGPRGLFSAAWIDGFLIGLLLAQASEG